MDENVENPPITENPCSPAPHLPPEMMEKILQYLPLKDLLSCRLVWKNHDDITKSFIGKKMKPILFNVKTEGLRDHLKNNPNSAVPNELHLKLTFEEDHETIKEICDNLRGKIKHLKIDMSRNHLGDRETGKMITARAKNQSQKLTVVNARLLVHVMEALGESLETLEFEIFNSGFLQVANKLARKSSLAGNFNFPLLQKIKILGEPPKGKSGDEQLSVWNQLIFKSCAKLKSLQLQRFNSRKKAAEVLKDLHEVGRLTQITSLGLRSVNSGQTERNLDTLLKYEADGGLQIEELRIERTWIHADNDRDHEYVQKLEWILKMQSKKLKTFALKGSGFKDFKMPVMEQLTSLKLATEDCLLEKICFSKITPKLKFLEVEIGESDEKEENEIIDKTDHCTTLETLKIYPEVIYWIKKHVPLNLRVCEIVANKFPSITSLTLIRPSEEFVQRLWTAWPNLRYLALVGEFKDLDRSLFGITPEWKKSVDKNVDQWWTLSQPPPDSQIESVCNLTKLQALGIYRDRIPDYKRVRRNQRRPERRQIGNSFSEFSYFYGLKNMKRLKVFSMNQGSSFPHEEEISVEVRDFIRKELPSLRIHYY